MVTAEAVLEGCYESFAAALEAGSGGAIDVPDAISPPQLSPRMLDRSMTSAPDDTLIGTEFHETDFSSGSTAFFAATGCGQNNYQEPDLPPSLNDDFESGKGFHNCDRNRKFKHQNFGGEDRLCTPNCADYGSLRNEISSLKWRNAD
jgi:hypothetical protein